MKFKKGDVIIHKEELLKYIVKSTMLYAAINVDMEVRSIDAHPSDSIFTNSRHFMSLEEYRNVIINTVLYEV